MPTYECLNLMSFQHIFRYNEKEIFKYHEIITEKFIMQYKIQKELFNVKNTIYFKAFDVFTWK